MIWRVASKDLCIPPSVYSSSLSPYPAFNSISISIGAVAIPLSCHKLVLASSSTLSVHIRLRTTG
ncbi:hypothetical protein M404DRAFT_1000317 [Pisolithus tinctorius Marx 270]|uniref:Uncharacterized protein n=1 Tax=Pisolithus tinctorius Marx 270 TaxID=870435 RepID=A0A0C3NV78_PISTI|nr:hypothetical protein M404DRAFT_1000317 [Pisolithus tinctorius Marx 270]